MIDAATVDRLGLRRCRLHKPMHVGMAIAGEEVELKEYIFILPFTLDLKWFSKRLQAVIVPRLCM